MKVGEDLGTGVSRRGWWVGVLSIVVLVLCPGLAPVTAQQPGGEVLRNVQVVAMSKAGISPDVIILKMETSTTQFDTSPNALAVLRSAGVHASVVTAMMRIGGSSPSSAAPAGSRPAAAADGGKPLLVIEPFTLKSGISWPYDMKQLQAQAAATLNARPRLRERFEIVTERPLTERAVYTLSGEVLSWTAGNRATRLVVGMGTGRESAEIRYRLTDASGAQVFEQSDTIRAEFVGNAMAGSVGQLSQPFSSKLADRLQDARVGTR